MHLRRPSRKIHQKQVRNGKQDENSPVPPNPAVLAPTQTEGLQVLVPRRILTQPAALSRVGIQELRLRGLSPGGQVLAAGLVSGRGEQVEVLLFAGYGLVFYDGCDEAAEEVGEGVEPVELLFEVRTVLRGNVMGGVFMVIGKWR